MFQLVSAGKCTSYVLRVPVIASLVGKCTYILIFLLAPLVTSALRRYDCVFMRSNFRSRADIYM